MGSSVIVMGGRGRRRGLSSCFLTFQDVYTLEVGLLGEGAGGRVLPCVTKCGGESRAVKVVQAEGRLGRMKALREVGLAARCGTGHSGIVQLVEFFEEDSVFYLVFERMEGSLMEKLIRDGAMAENEVANVARQLLSALGHLHSLGITHRDVKLENVLFRGEELKLADFDLACEGLSTDMAGTAEFLAPEVVNVFYGLAKNYGPECDLWSLGVLLYTLLAGRTPFTGRCGKQCGWEEGGNCPSCFGILLAKISHFTPDLVSPPWNTISPHCKIFISKLLAKDAKDRMTAAEALDHHWLKKSTDFNRSQNPEGKWKETSDCLQRCSSQETSAILTQPLTDTVLTEKVGEGAVVSQRSQFEANWLNSSQPFVSVCLSMEEEETLNLSSDTIRKSQTTTHLTEANHQTEDNHLTKATHLTKAIHLTNAIHLAEANHLTKLSSTQSPTVATCPLLVNQKGDMVFYQEEEEKQDTTDKVQKTTVEPRAILGETNANEPDIGVDKNIRKRAREELSKTILDAKKKRPRVSQREDICNFAAMTETPMSTVFSKIRRAKRKKQRIAQDLSK